MGRAVLITALLAVLPAQNLADQGNNEQSKEAARKAAMERAQHTVASDKATLEGAIKKTENAAKDLRIVAKNQSQAMALSRNLAKEAQTQTEFAAQTQKDKAEKDFSISLAQLKQETNSSKFKEREEAAREKSKHLDALAEAQDKTAVEVLHRQRKARDDEVVQSYHEAHQAARNMLKDKDTLAKAMKHAGESEEDYERLQGKNEHFAERLSDLAEHQAESADDVIEHIFERAEDYLLDIQVQARQRHAKDRHQRLRSIQDAMETLQQTAKENKASKAEASDAALPINLLATRASSKEAGRQEELAARKEEMQKAQQIVASDKAKLEAAVTKTKNAAKDLRIVAQNRTHAEALSINLAEEVSNQAAQDTKKKQDKAMEDYYTALYTLKKSQATGNWEQAEKNVRQKSDNLDKLNEEEKNTAREKLSSRRKARDNEVRQSYRESQEAARNLLKDKDRLEVAQRRAGQAENQYEKEELSNEMLAERSQDFAERQHDDASDAIELIFEGAEDHLQDMQHQSRKSNEAAAHQRRQAIQGAVEALRTEAQAAKKAEAAKGAIDLLAIPAKKTTKEEAETEAQQKVASDRYELNAAVKKTENNAKDFRIAAKNRTLAEAFSLNLAEEVQNKVNQDTINEKKQAMDDFSTALYALKNSATTDMDSAEKAARQKSDRLDEVDETQDRTALRELKSRRQARREEVRRSFREANHAAINLIEDKDHLENAQRRAGTAEREYEREELSNERFAERSRDHAERQRDEANDAIDLIFDRAEHHLGEMRRQTHKDHRAARHQRDQSIEQAVRTVREETKTQAVGKKKEKKAVSSSFSLPLNLAAVSANNKKEETVQESEQTVASDRANLNAAIKKVEDSASDLRYAAKNRTRADTLGRQLAQEVHNEAHHASSTKEEQATQDFSIALVALQKSSATGKWEDAERSARQKSDNVEKAQKEEERTAKDKLQSRRQARIQEVHRSYHDAVDAARKMLKDRNRLENAEQRARESEQAREKEEMQNERYAEHLRDHAEHQKDDADDAIDQIFQRAEDHLDDIQRPSREARRTTANERHQAIQEAVETLRTEAQAAKKAEAATAAKKAKEAKEEKDASDASHSDKLIAVSYDAYAPSVLLAAASLGLLVLYVVRSRRRPIPDLAPPLLG